MFSKSWTANNSQIKDLLCKVHLNPSTKLISSCLFPSKLANGKEVIAKLGLCKLMSWSRPGSIELGPTAEARPSCHSGLLLVQPDHVTWILASGWLTTVSHCSHCSQQSLLWGRRHQAIRISQIIQYTMYIIHYTRGMTKTQQRVKLKDF